MRRRPVVAIDGPAGAGKSTVARRVAEELGYFLVDTGALYRSVALAAERARLGWDDAAGVSQHAVELVQANALCLEPGQGGAFRVLLHGEDVSDEIRSQRIAEGASKVSALPGVRQALLALQRTAGAEGGVVLEGRDIGTVVFPDAEAKLFVTASPEVRARRRQAELAERGSAPSLEQVLTEVIERDRRDSTRAVAPLRRADDALAIDTSALAIDDVVAQIVGHVREVAERLSAAVERSAEGGRRDHKA